MIQHRDQIFQAFLVVAVGCQGVKFLDITQMPGCQGKDGIQEDWTRPCTAGDYRLE